MWAKQREELVAKAKSLLAERERDNQALSEADRTQLKSWSDELDAGDRREAKTREDAGLAAKFRQPLDGSQGDGSGALNDASDFFSRGVTKSLAERLATKSAKAAEPGNVKAFTLTDATDEVVTGLHPLPHRPQSLLAALQLQRVTSPTFKFLTQQVRTNNAAPVAAGATKPTTVLGLTPVNRELRVVAHLSEPVDKYLAEDVKGLAQFVQAELTFGLYEALEQQVLDGTGTAPQLHGLNATSGVQTQAFDTDVLTTVRKSLTKLELLGYVPRAVVLRPEDWETAELSQTTGSGDYVLAASPVDRAAQKLWGVPVVLSTAPEVAEGYLLAQDAVTLFTDGRVAAEWDASTGFDKNQVRLRVESRFEVGTTLPSGVVRFETQDAG